MQKYIKDIARLWTILKPFHKHFYFQLGLILLGQLFIIAIAYLNSNLLNSLVQKNVHHVFLFLGLWVIVFCFNMLVDYATRRNADMKLEQTLYQYLQEFSLKNILNLTVAQHIEDHSALKLSIISNGEASTQNIINRIITTIVPSVTLVLLTLGTLFFYSATIAFFCIGAMVVIFFYAYYFNKKRYPLMQQNRDNWNENYKIRAEAFTHLQLVKLLHREDSFIKKYLANRLRVVKYHLELRLGTINIGTARATLTEFSSLFTLGLASFFFLQGAFSVGTIYLIFSLTSRAYLQVSSLSNIMREIPKFYADTEKYIQIMDMQPAFSEHGKTKVNLNGEISVSELSFTYPKGERATLENMTFSIPFGKTTAFVGASGSGKSTIVKLFLRAYDYSKGSIKIGGVELRSIDAGYLREHIGYVEQHVDLFDDTIRENILIGVREKNRKAAESHLEEIAAKARITEFYYRLGEKRFDTVVGERGIKLSGGERQRVGIARAIIKDPEILIFDEATSSLDSENERYVMEAINDVSKGKTTIIIAHRLSTVRNANKIIVMEKGRVAGEGTHDELMQSSPVYQNLVAHQLS
jgi:ABC-type multidrug transport system fused ATPase/permease subunit